MGQDDSTPRECGEQHVDAKNTFFCEGGKTCGSRICKNCMRQHNGQRLCLECYIQATKTKTTGVVKPSDNFKQTGGVKVTKNGEFFGWDSIFD